MKNLAEGHRNLLSTRVSKPLLYLLLLALGLLAFKLFNKEGENASKAEDYRLRQISSSGAQANKNMASCIVLGLNGNGVQTTKVGDGAYFDHDNNGFSEQTGWTSPNDGLLVRDLNVNGLIDAGRELFGSETLLSSGAKASDGFEALKELDSNHDGKIDALDVAFSTLKVWKDLDGDGYTSRGELFSLSDVGVKSINIAYTISTNIDAQGNEIRRVGSYIKANGTTAAVHDIWFKVDRTYTLATDWLDVPADVLALPDLQGYGNVYDLHQAIVRDTSGQLKTMVKQFIAATTQTGRRAVFEQLLYIWAGADSINPTSRGPYVDARKLAVLEKFMGEYFVGVSTPGMNDPTPHAKSGPILMQTYGDLYEAYYGQLMAQTHLKSLYDAISYKWDDASQSLKGDIKAVAMQLRMLFTTNRSQGLATLEEFVRSLKGMDAVEMMNTSEFRAALAPIGTDVTAIIDAVWSDIPKGKKATIPSIPGADKPSRKRNKSEAEMKNTRRQVANDWEWREVA